MDKDLRLALMTGIDIPIPECKLIVHQPRIEEIAFLGESVALLVRLSLGVSEEEIYQLELRTKHLRQSL